MQVDTTPWHASGKKFLKRYQIERFIQFCEHAQTHTYTYKKKQYLSLRAAKRSVEPDRTRVNILNKPRFFRNQVLTHENLAGTDQAECGNHTFSSLAEHVAPFCDACAYVCKYVCVCEYVHVSMSMECMCVFMYACIYVYVCVCVYVCMYVCVYVCMYACVCLYTFRFECVHAYIRTFSTYT
jgi:hypothetical protein